MKDKFKIDLRKLLVELLVIVLGVTGAFWAENLRQNLENRRLEATYLERLAEELEDHDDMIEIILRESESYDTAAKEVLTFLDTSADTPFDTTAILRSVAWVGFLREMPLITVTFDELLSTGSLALIRDEELRSELAYYYYQSKRRSEAFDQASSSMQSFVSHTLPVDFTRESQQCGLEIHGLISAQLCKEVTVAEREVLRTISTLRSSTVLPGYLREVVWYAQDIRYRFLRQREVNSETRARISNAI